MAKKEKIKASDEEAASLSDSLAHIMSAQASTMDALKAVVGAVSEIMKTIESLGNNLLKQSIDVSYVKGLLRHTLTSSVEFDRQFGEAMNPFTERFRKEREAREARDAEVNNSNQPDLPLEEEKKGE